MRELSERPNGEDAERAYRRLKGPALLKARRWFPTLSETDLEDVYQSAWLSVVRTSSPIADLRSYLYEAVRSEALTELRRRRRRSALGLSEVDARLSRNGWRDEDAATPTAGMLEESLIDDEQAGPEDQAQTQLLAAYAHDLLSDLSARQQAVVKLRWAWGFSRREIAGVMGISEKAVKRELERSGTVLAEGAEQVGSRRWCQRRRSLVTAYAMEILSARQAARAELHLHACAGCRALVHELRRRAEEVAAVAPAPALTHVPGDGPFPAVLDGLEKIRGHAVDLVSGAKHQAVSLSVRASDPTPLAGARPGAVAAAVAGCLAVGAGGYCAVQGIAPVPLKPGQAKPVAAKPHPEKSQADQLPRPAEVTPAPNEPEPKPAPTTAPSPPPTTSPAPAASPPPSTPPPPKPQSQEFFDSGTNPAPASPSTHSAAPAPAPATPRGEFDGP
jgi:RNA polymerase sigma factor (sigma-70 family)